MKYSEYTPGTEAYAARLKRNLASETYTVDGVLHWTSSNNAVPLHVFREAGVEAPSRQREGIQRQNAAFLIQYRAARAAMTPEQREEEAFERRAAFGPGEEVVNILTGERFRT